MNPKTTIILRCPNCKHTFEVDKGDKLHPYCSTDKPEESDVTEDIIPKVYDCRNPDCREPITVYYYKPKVSFDLV